MSLLGFFKKSILGQVLAVALPCIAATWIAVTKVQVEPRDFAIEERDKKIWNLEEQVRQLTDSLRWCQGGRNDPAYIETLSRKILEQAQEAILAHSYSDALRKLDVLLSLQVDEAKAHIIRGRIYLENLELYENALTEFTRAWEQDRDSKYLPYYIGLTHYRLGNLDEAIAWNDLALAKDPDLIIALHHKGLYCMNYGEQYYEEAEDCFEDVISRDREFAPEARLYLLVLYFRFSEREGQAPEKVQYRTKAERLIEEVVTKEMGDKHKTRGGGLVFLQRITGEIQIGYHEDLRPVRRDLESMRSDTSFMRMVQTGIRHLAD